MDSLGEGMNVKSSGKKIALFGVSLSNNNLGLRALSRSVISLVSAEYPDAEVILFSYTPGEPDEVQMHERKLVLHSELLNNGINFLLKNNIINCYVRSLLFKWFGIKLFQQGSPLAILQECSLAFDITAGDSFSDIYGIKRLLTGCFQKMMIKNIGLRLIYLPQTFGPFRSFFSKMLARKALLCADDIFVRDKESLGLIKGLGVQKEVRIFPDVAFVLSQKLPCEDKRDLIGININGLVYQRTDQGKARFKLVCDYPAVIEKILHFLLEEAHEKVVLVPHALSSRGIDSDVEVIQQILKKWDHPDLTAVKPMEDEQKIGEAVTSVKLFIGTRMHACIRACCHLTPTICLAYSGKFKGVMERVGYDRFVLDMRTCSTDELFERFKTLYLQREEMSVILRREIPQARKELDSLLDHIVIE